MLTDLANGLRDAVICYHVDRHTRRPVKLEQFVATVNAAGVRKVRFMSGDMDLGTGDGLLIGRIMAAVAANESAAKSRRMRRKSEQNAASGVPHGGSTRPFGYEADRVTVRQDEADVIRQIVARYVAGESLRSLCTWLTEQGVSTVTGRAWRSPTLRGLLRSGRIAGLREHLGEVVGPAQWPAIIDPADRDRVLARMAERVASGRRTPRRYVRCARGVAIRKACQGPPPAPCPSPTRTRGRQGRFAPLRGGLRPPLTADHAAISEAERPRQAVEPCGVPGVNPGQEVATPSPPLLPGKGQRSPSGGLAPPRWALQAVP